MIYYIFDIQREHLEGVDVSMVENFIEHPTTLRIRALARSNRSQDIAIAFDRIAIQLQLAAKQIRDKSSNREV